MSALKILHAPSRRGFLACSGAAFFSRLALADSFDSAALLPRTKAKVRLIFAHPVPERQGWPYQHYDYEGRKKMYLEKLSAACPEIDFLPATVGTAEEATAALAAGGDVDGYLVYILGIPSDVRPIALSGRPVILVDDLYGGTGQFLGAYPQALAQGKPVAGVSSSRLGDVAEAANAFVAIRKMKASTLLDITDRDLGQSPAVYERNMGVKIQPVPVADFNGAYEAADRQLGDRWAEFWTRHAEKTLEPDAAELKKSGAMYIGMRNLLARHKAQGIAVDCLRLFYSNQMHAYPCLGFFQMNNDGLVGACEADLQSAATMLVMTYLTGRPGYISDPVIDTAKNQIIYAHCVAPSKVYGPRGPENPYHIRDHSEDRKGAAVRSLLPTGEMTTSLKFLPDQKLVVIHRAKTVENIDDDRACRTKIAAEPRDARALMKGWKHGWHRVTVYGDWQVQVENLAALMGFRVEEEG